MNKVIAFEARESYISLKKVWAFMCQDLESLNNKNPEFIANETYFYDWLRVGLWVVVIILIAALIEESVSRETWETIQEVAQNIAIHL